MSHLKAPEQYIVTEHELHVRALARAIDFWRNMAAANMKRALAAEVALTEYEGRIELILENQNDTVASR